MSDAAIIEARAVTKEFRRRDRVLTQVLRGVDLAVPAGQIVGIHGAVASGKTTLLRLFAALERPTSGDILYAGRPLWSHTWRGWRPSTPRRGFALPVFKNAVASLDPSWPLWRTVTEAACLAGVVRTRALAERQRLATDLLARVGLSRERINDAPKHLSASQCQQVAILRLIAARPAAALLDEPTSTIERTSVTAVLWMLRGLAEGGAAVVVFSEDMAMLAGLTPRLFELRDGVLAAVERES